MLINNFPIQNDYRDFSKSNEEILLKVEKKNWETKKK